MMRMSAFAAARGGVMWPLAKSFWPLVFIHGPFLRFVSIFGFRTGSRLTNPEVITKADQLAGARQCVTSWKIMRVNGILRAWRR